MFNFLVQNKKGELQDLLDVISVDIEALNYYVVAEEKAEGMIAKAIAKSEIVLSDGHNQRRDEVYYRLNVQPNDNQSGTDFWFAVAKKMLQDGECVIVTLGGKLYICTGWTMSNSVMAPKVYRSVTITDGTDSFTLNRGFSADEVLHIRFDNQKIRAFMNRSLQRYDEALSAATTMSVISSTPKFKWKINASISFREKKADGTDKILTADNVADKLKRQIEDKGIQIIREQDGTSLEYLNIDSKISASDLAALTSAIDDEAAKAYDIPLAVYNGNITEKSDATNEFITFAVQPVAEAITDAMNAKLVGQEGYVRGERAYIWLSHFKHADLLDAANSLDKLRGIGFSLDEIREAVGYPALNTDFSTARALTKNYATEGTGEGDATDDQTDEGHIQITEQKLSKHRERRLKRNAKQ